VAGKGIRVVTMKFEDPNFSIRKQEHGYDTEAQAGLAALAYKVLAHRGDFAIDDDGRDVGEAIWSDANEGKDFTLFEASGGREPERVSYRLEFGPSQDSEHENSEAKGTYSFGLGEGSTFGRKGAALLDDDGQPNNDSNFHIQRLRRYLKTGLPPEVPPEDVGPESPMISGWQDGSET